MGNTSKKLFSNPEPPKVSLAPTEKRKVDEEEPETECPICFESFYALNVTVCCKGKICTTCHLDLRNQKKSKDALSCPFCNSTKYTVFYTLKTANESNNSNISNNNVTNTANNNSGPNDLKVSQITVNISENSFDSTPTPNPTPTKPKKSTPILLASVSDRKAIESEVKNQRQSDRSLSLARSFNSTSSRSFSIESPGHMLSVSPPSYMSGFMGSPNSRRNVSNRDNSQNISDLSLGDMLHSFLNEMSNNGNHGGDNEELINFEGMSDSEKLEQIMILQAIQLSLNDQKQNDKKQNTNTRNEDSDNDNNNPNFGSFV